MELKEGMYVRTKKGIAKIVKIFNKEDEPYDGAKYRTDTFLEIYYDSEYIGDEDIIKASYNIIDLIEVGDYVNGYEATSKDQFLGFGNHDWYMLDNEIKSIVTKEQFESMSYKVGE